MKRTDTITEIRFCVGDLIVNVDGIILAAGSSTRFGRTKQLENWTGPDGIARPLVKHITEIALQSNLRHIYLVIGHDREKIKTAIRPVINDERLRIIENNNFAEGQSTSVHSALAAMSAGTDAAMFLLCDQPRITSELINELIDLYARETPLICAPVANEKRGNPVIFSSQLFPELMLIKGDTGGRVLITEYWDNAVKLNLESDDVFMDIDTIDDLPRS